MTVVKDSKIFLMAFLLKKIFVKKPLYFVNIIIEMKISKLRETYLSSRFVLKYVILIKIFDFFKERQEFKRNPVFLALWKIF